LETNRLSGTQFFLRRVARLYPLHATTLLLAALLLYLYYCLFAAQYWFYVPSSWFAFFMLQLFMASNWFSSEYTFNGPIWSVSVEILIYILFFFTTKYFPLERIMKTLVVFIFSAILYVIIIQVTHGRINFMIWIAQCAVCFYLGGIIYEIKTKYSAFVSPMTAKSVFLWTTIVSAVVVCYSLRPTYATAFAIPAVAILLIVSIDMIEKSKFVSRISWIGNMTYGSYLLQFPVALCMVIVMNISGINLQVAYSPAFLGVYVVTVFTLAALSYPFFEAPARRALTAMIRPVSNNPLKPAPGSGLWPARERAPPSARSTPVKRSR